MMRMAAGVLLVGVAVAQDTPLECKKYEVSDYKGCDDVTALNTCSKVTEPDNTLCRYQSEKDMCADPTVTNITACEAKYPISINATSDEATSPLTPITLKPKSWIFLEATVAAGVPMYSAKYSLQVAEQASSGGADEKNISVAFLVGRCLDEVECGQCPPRAETLMSTEREPQICTLPDYCPGCTERLGQEGGCGTYAPLATEECAVTPGTTAEETTAATTCTLTSGSPGSCATATGSGTCDYVPNSKEYTGKWSNLKRCQTEPEDTKFYIGIYAMDSVFGSGIADEPVDVKLKVWWDETSAGPRTVPSVLLALCVAIAAMFH